MATHGTTGIPRKFGEPPPDDHKGDVPVASTMVVIHDDSETKWKDVPWAIAFYVHVIAIAVLAFVIGVSEVISAVENWFDSGCFTMYT